MPLNQLVATAERVLYCTAMVLLVGSGLHVIFGWHLHRVVGEKRGAVAFLQVLPMMSLRSSCYLVH